MSRDEQIRHWLKGAEEDWESALLLLSNKRHVQGLFLLHLTIEKLLKAKWQVDNVGFPPKTHDLLFIQGQTNLNLDEETLALLNVINTWNLEGRYTDYKNSFYKLATDRYVANYLDSTKRLRKWLLEKLQ
ncbi:MAG TPA: HEPN domain-containing protein [Cyclobacteriaceae bacterium]|nr:HEPN domain-containing protein [Cyclobacteriaceae bacterium]